MEALSQRKALEKLKVQKEMQEKEDKAILEHEQYRDLTLALNLTN